MNIHTLIRVLRDYNQQLPIVILEKGEDYPLMLSDISFWTDNDNNDVKGEHVSVMHISVYREPSQPQRIYDPNQKLTIDSLIQHIYENFELVETTHRSVVYIEDVNGSSSDTLDVESVGADVESVGADGAKYGKLILHVS